MITLLSALLTVPVAIVLYGMVQQDDPVMIASCGVVSYMLSNAWVRGLSK